MATTPVRVVAGAVALGVATVSAELLYAAHRPLPAFADLDPTGTHGGLPRPLVRITVLGDSTCTGPGLDDPDDIWIRRVAQHLRPELQISLRSLAMGGARVQALINRQLGPALEHGGDVAVVSIGANDVLRGYSADRLEADLDMIVAALLSRFGAVVLAGIGDMGTAPRIPFPLDRYASRVSIAGDAAHRRVAERTPRVHKVDMWDLTVEQFRTREDIWSDDLFHPNPLGHEIWADAAIPTLTQAIQTARRHRLERRHRYLGCA